MTLNVGTPVNRGYAEAVDSSSDLVVTLGQALTAGRFALCAVQVGHDNSTTPSAPSSVTGGGVTWTLHDTYSWDAAGTNRSIFFLYRAAVVTPSGTTVTIVPAGAYASIQAEVIETPNVAITGTNGSDGLHATHIEKATAGTANLIEVASTTLGNAANAKLAFALCSNGTAARTWTPDAAPAFTELLDEASPVSAGAKYRGFHVSYRLQGGDTNPTVGATTSASIDLNGIVVYELVGAEEGPTIDTQPTAQTALVVPATPAVFTTAATTSGGPLTYQWQKEDSVGAGTYANVANGAVYAGVTTASLTITTTDESLHGLKYRCNVTDDNGTTATSGATLSAYTGHILVQPSASAANGDAPSGSVANDYDQPDAEFSEVYATCDGVVIGVSHFRGV